MPVPIEKYFFTLVMPKARCRKKSKGRKCGYRAAPSWSLKGVSKEKYAVRIINKNTGKLVKSFAALPPSVKKHLAKKRKCRT